MARPIPDIDIQKLVEEEKQELIKPRDKEKTFIDFTIDGIKSDTGKNIILGTISGWITGVTVVRVGRIAAFGIGGCIILLHLASEWGYIHVNWDRVKQSVGEGQACVEKMVGVLKKNSCFSVGFLGGFFFGIGSTLQLKPIPPLAPPDHERPLPPDPIPPKPPEFIPEEPIFEKPTFMPQKPIPHSPKISPSSIPIPNPSVTTNKQVEPGYPSYGGYLYSIPGYSAFQPVSYPGMVQPNQSPINEAPAPEFGPFPSKPTNEPTPEEAKMETEIKEVQNPPTQTDFEEHFTPEVIPAANSDAKTQTVESKMSITSLTQGSGATITIPSQNITKDIRKKPTERYSLKTSIPISKIDMKCVSTPPDSVYQNAIAKKHLNPAFTKDPPKLEIQSNIMIKSATKEVEVPDKPITPTVNSSTNTPSNSIEVVNKAEHQFRVPEPKVDVAAEVKDNSTLLKPIFNPINIDSSKGNSNKQEQFNEQKKQIVLIQNKNNSNSKMLLTIQQPNPQVLVQRTNGDSKNLQAPSRPSSQSKKGKEDINEGSSSKVVALKRLHQENCDENDFENLITENQIYGNKIVVKEKSQGTHQEQDIINKKQPEKNPTTETKNVVLHPNFLYLSNVQFPGNLMMIKNKTKIIQTSENNTTKSNENKTANESNAASNTDPNLITKTVKPNSTVNKEIHVLKSSNNLLQAIPNKTRPELVIQTNQKVLMNPQFVYQVPIVSSIVDNEKVINRDYPTFIAPKTDFPKKQYETKPNDKLYIACPYQMDSKLQPKIVITNIRPKINKLDETSSLDIYEKKKRMRRLKYLTNRENKDTKTEIHNGKVDNNITSKSKIVYTDKKVQRIITPDNMKNEIYREFTNVKEVVDDSSSESDLDDYGEEELKVYDSIIEEYQTTAENIKEKEIFLRNFSLASFEAYKEKELDIQDSILRRDAVASAYAAVGRLDTLHHKVVEENVSQNLSEVTTVASNNCNMAEETRASIQRKKLFMTRLNLSQVTSEYKEGYENVWKEVIKERKRRNDLLEGADKPKQLRSSRLEFDSNNQLRLLTEIKKSVNENNNLIKKRLDSVGESNQNSNENSIHVLAEKNISELNRLSKMADRSVKLFSGKNPRKRDLNPGFDSENIQETTKKVEQPFENYPKLNIPSISKIVSLKSKTESQPGNTTQATSMDEPQNSAAGVKEMFQESTSEVKGKTRDMSCQVDFIWPGFQAMINIFKEHEAATKKEISELHRRNTALRVEGAHITCAASRDSDRARALLAERQNLAVEESNLRLSLHRLRHAIEVIRNC